jgi:hypothetical protein
MVTLLRRIRTSLDGKRDAGWPASEEMLKLITALEQQKTLKPAPVIFAECPFFFEDWPVITFFWRCTIGT